MKNGECPREDEVLDAIGLDDWSDELQAHCHSCAACRDLAEVASALSGDHAALLAGSRVPPAALVWWLAELEGRREAARRATRPITLIHALAAACTLGVTVSLGKLLMVPGWEMVRGWSGALMEGVARLLPETASPGDVALGMGPLGIALFLALVSCVISAPLAAWFILSDDD
jgi:hypothetical protein